MKKFMMGWLPVLLVIGVIFYSSSQPYKKQDMRSSIVQHVNPETVKQMFSWVHFHYGHSEISIAHDGVGGFLEFFIRKGAHFCVFFTLGFLACRAFFYSGISRRNAFLFPLLLVASYASFDEIHQWFTGDRTPLWQDSLLDTIGGLTGITVRSLMQRKSRG
ncbi:VanZ family protein [Microbacteriaceae bacterium 4G12]